MAYDNKPQSNRSLNTFPPSRQSNVIAFYSVSMVWLASDFRWTLPTIHLRGIEIVASPVTLLKNGPRLCETQQVAVGRIGIHQRGNAHLQTL